jgi:Right handed beta helix region
VLTTHNGDLVITTPNAVISGLNVEGSITVEASNVTIRDVRVTSSDYAVVREVAGYSGLTVENSEVVGSASPGSGTRGVSEEGNGVTVLQCNIHGVETGVWLLNNALVQDSYIHDLSLTASVDGIRVGGGSSNDTVRHNTVEAATGDGAIDLSTDWGPDVNILVENNLASGANYTLDGGAASGSRQIRFIDNHISRKFYPNGGQYGPVTGYDNSEPGNQWAGNVWDDTNLPISP